MVATGRRLAGAVTRSKPMVSTKPTPDTGPGAGCSSATALSSNVLASAAADELSRSAPTPGRRWWRCALLPAARRRTLLGPFFLVAGAWMIASANACAKLLYLHGAVSS